jgi:lipoate-protein ligase A
MIQTMTITDALAQEMDLLAKAAADPSQKHILFWQSNQALVAPRKLSSNPEFARAEAALATLGWPVHTRATGGDVTPQGPGIVNVSLIYASHGPPDIDATYDTLCTPMERTLGPNATRGWNPGAFCDGAYNVQWQGKKFAGPAQRLKRCKNSDRSAVLAHALMLMSPPSKDAIDALNLFLEILGEPRRIDANCHTGLPSGLTQSGFIQDLAAAYKAALP